MVKGTLQDASWLVHMRHPAHFGAGAATLCVTLHQARLTHNGAFHDPCPFSLACLCRFSSRLEWEAEPERVLHQ